MDEHIRIGREEFPTIHNHTTYSFGIDDQEFMTAFECDEPADFMHLMLRLRDSEASRYTERDTPIFVGQHVPVREALARLDGLSHSSKTTVRRVTAPRSCSSTMRPVPPCDHANAAATWCSSFSWMPSSWIVSVGRLVDVGAPDRVEADERAGRDVLEVQLGVLCEAREHRFPVRRRRPQR